jgi:RHS repeat-associated protein
MVTNSSAALVVNESFDIFGARRASDWSINPPAGMTPMADATRRGYTGHEHLDNLGLIHMNGRVQDPVLGRFISADPFVQAPYFSQSLNRYSYLFNNPLSGTDPTGFMNAPGCAGGSGDEGCSIGLGSNMFDFNFIINDGFYLNTFPYNPLDNLSDLYRNINVINPCAAPPGGNRCNFGTRPQLELGYSGSTNGGTCLTSTRGACHTPLAPLPSEVQAAYRATEFVGDVLGQTWDVLNRSMIVGPDGEPIPYYGGTVPTPGIGSIRNAATAVRLFGSHSAAVNVVVASTHQAALPKS